MRFYITAFLLMVLLFGAADAASFTYKNNDNVQYQHLCFDENTNYCPSTITSYINVAYPNGTIAVDNQTMFFNNSYRSYPIPTTPNGVYSVIIVEHDNNSTAEFTYEVNPTGIPPSESRTETLTRSIYFIFGLAVLFFLAFLYLENVTVKYSFFIFALIFILIGVNILFVSMQDEVINPTVEGFFDVFTATSFYLFWFLGGMLMIIWIFTFLNTHFYKQNMENARRYDAPF